MPSEAALRSVIELLRSPVVLLQADDTITYASDAFCAAIGYPRNELLGEPFSAVLDTDDPLPDCTPDDLPRSTTVQTSVGRTRTIRWTDYIPTADGQYLFGQLSGPSPSEDDARHAAIDPYRTFVENYPDGLVTLFNEDHRYLVAGGTAFEDLDIAPGTLEGARLEEVFPPENVERLKPAYDAALEGHECAMTLALKDREFTVQVLPIRDANGAVVAGMTISRDVTQRQERERELDRARARYSTIIEEAPVPIFVGDEGGMLVEMNQAAETLLDRDRETLIGAPVTALHPDDDAAQYAALYESYYGDSGACRYLGSGEQLSVVTADGETIPVEINVTTVTHNSEELALGVFRDISEQVWYESALENLHRNAETLLQAETDIEVAEILVQTATEILDLSLVSVNLFRETTGELEPAAYSEDVSSIIGTPPPLPLTESVAGDAYVENTTVNTSDVRSHNSVYDRETDVRSQLIVPIDEYGVIISGATSRDVFDRRDQRLLELLARHAEAVLERTDRERELRQRESELAERAATLEDVELVNEQLRDLIRIAAESESRVELATEACRRLISHDQFVFAWLGTPTENHDALKPDAWAGDEQGYLGEQSFEITPDTTEPSVRAARTGEVTVVPNVARDARSDGWRREAIRRGFRSVIAVPITYRGSLYSVLTVFTESPKQPSERVIETFEEWASLLGCVLNKFDRTDAILADYETRATFELSTASCPLVRIAQQCRCTLGFAGLQEYSAGGASVFVTVPESSAPCLEEAARAAAEITSLQRIRRTESSDVYQVTIAKPFIASVLARYGLRLRRITGTDDASVRVDVLLPTTMPVHWATARVSDEYSDAELVTTEDVETSLILSTQLVEDVLEQLTERQRETLKLAYHGGYFETPKGRSGTELAEQMGISTSAFHNHLHAAQQAVFKSLLE